MPTTNRPWTKGPWIIDPNPELPLAVINPTEGGIEICQLEGERTDPEIIANAQLIAQAPALYEALSGLYEAYEAIDTEMDIPMDVLVAACNRAKGVAIKALAAANPGDGGERDGN